MTDDVRTQLAGTQADGAVESAARLLVYMPEGGELRTRVIEVPDGAEIGFGRSRAEVVYIDSETVSRHHAVLTRVGAELTLRDRGSRNGTRVNGERITTAVTVRAGDEISVGPVTAIVAVATRPSRRAMVATTAVFEERLAAEVDRGHRYRRSVGVVMLRLEGGDAAVDSAVDAVAAQLRPMDVIAEYGPDELALVVPEAESAGLEELARRLSRVAHDCGDVDVRVGAARFPEHGAQPGELVSRARAALRAARRGGVELVSSPPADATPTSAELVVADPQMKRVFALVDKVADTPLTVLITGETGAGKEIVAEQLHRASGRCQAPFLRINCASIAETLLESELFGHEKGAFTSADRRKKGYFEAADGGTLFLDEIGEVSSGLQAKLLRVLEERRFNRVGGTAEIAVDVRVVCATNRDLEAEVARGTFREDLYFRVSAFTILVPPLRDRGADIVPLAELFARQAAAELGCATPVLLPEAVHALRAYRWPGNVRELRNAMERAVVLATGAIGVEHLPDRLRDELAGRDEGAPVGRVRARVAEVEKSAIVEALAANNGNQTRTAAQLGLSRRALIYKLEKYGLKPPPGRR